MTKTCNQCSEVKDKIEFSGRSLKCKYCTNQNSIKKREEKALLEGKEFKYHNLILHYNNITDLMRKELGIE